MMGLKLNILPELSHEKEVSLLSVTEVWGFLTPASLANSHMAVSTMYYRKAYECVVELP